MRSFRRPLLYFGMFMVVISTGVATILGDPSWKVDAAVGTFAIGFAMGSWMD